MPGWLKGPERGRGRIQDEKDTIFAFKETACYVGACEYTRARTHIQNSKEKIRAKSAIAVVNTYRVLL